MLSKYVYIFATRDGFFLCGSGWAVALAVTLWLNAWNRIHAHYKNCSNLSEVNPGGLIRYGKWHRATVHISPGGFQPRQFSTLYLSVCREVDCPFWFAPFTRTQCSVTLWRSQSISPALLVTLYMILSHFTSLSSILVYERSWVLTTTAPSLVLSCQRRGGNCWVTCLLRSVAKGPNWTRWPIQASLVTNIFRRTWSSTTTSAKSRGWVARTHIYVHISTPFTLNLVCQLVKVYSVVGEIATLKGHCWEGNLPTLEYAIIT